MTLAVDVRPARSRHRAGALVAVLAALLVACLGLQLGTADAARADLAGTITKVVTTDRVLTVGSLVATNSPPGRVFKAGQLILRLWKVASIASTAVTAIDLLQGATAAPEDRVPSKPNSAAWVYTPIKTWQQNPGGQIVATEIGWEPNAFVQANYSNCKTINVPGTCPFGATSSGKPETWIDGKIGCKMPNGVTSALPFSGTGFVVGTVLNPSGGCVTNGGRQVWIQWWPGGSCLTSGCVGSQTGANNAPSNSGFWGSPEYNPNDPRGGVTTEVRVNCQGSGPNGQLVTVVGSATGSDGLAQIPACPSGTTPTGAQLFAGAAGTALANVGGAVIDRPRIDQQYPLCASDGCALTVEIDGKPCTVGDADCWDWVKTWQATPSRARCLWGTYVMPMSDCEDLANGYRTGATAPAGAGQTGPGIAVDPNTGLPVPEAAPSVETKPNPWPYPSTTATGSPQPSTSPSTSAGPSTTAGPSTPPTGSTPPTPTGTPPEVDPPEETGGDCWGESITLLKPWTWVTGPVKCALQWAFVPPDGAMEQTLGGAKDSFADTGPGKWLGAVGDTFGTLTPPGGSSCRGPGVTIPVMDADSTFYPLSWCEQPATAARTLVFAVGLFAVGYGSVMVGLRLVAASLGLQIGWLGRRDSDGAT